MVWDKAFALAKNYGKEYFKDKITKEKAEEFAFNRLVKAGKHLSRPRGGGTTDRNDLRKGYRGVERTVDIKDWSPADDDHYA